jgi:hypothetical protein
VAEKIGGRTEQVLHPVGFPPVCKTTMRILHTSPPVLLAMLVSQLDSTFDRVGEMRGKCNGAKELLLETASGSSKGREECLFIFFHIMYTISNSQYVFTITRQNRSLRSPPFRTVAKKANH